MKGASLWVGSLLFLIGLMAAVGTGRVNVAEVLLIVVLGGIVATLAVLAADEQDRTWLPLMVMAGFVVKLVGSGVRYFVLTDVYSGVGDATGYYGRGIQYNDVWRHFQVPNFEIGSAGTTFTSKVTALLFTPFEPTQLGGFFIFATVAFIGQLVLYLAFRRALPRARAKWYAALIFFMPSMVFWPSSIGKDALMLFFISLVAWGAAHLLARYRLRWLIIIAAGLAGAGAIRLHIAALFGAALAVAVLLGPTPDVKAARTRRFVMMIASGLVVILLASLASSALGVDLSGDDLDPFLSELERRTQQGGSAVEGDPVRSIVDVPSATLRTLYRPLLNEAVNLQTRISGLEGTLLLIVSVLALPWMIRNIVRMRRYPYLIFSMAIVLGYIVAFSAVFNLGILAAPANPGVAVPVRPAGCDGQRPHPGAHPFRSRKEAEAGRTVGAGMSERIYLSPPSQSGEEETAVVAALRSNWIAPLGPEVDAFERELAAQSGVGHALATASGTAAIHLALIALGVTPGDVVIAPSFTFIGSVSPVTYLGAEPWFIDSEASSWNLDPDLLIEALETARVEGRWVGAVIAVDLFGQCADYERIAPICSEYGVPLIEDAAEALGATYRGRPAGSFGSVGILSFNGNKIITTSGGGAALSDDAAVVERCRHLATQAREPVLHYEHTEIGFNYRMSNILAALGRAQLATIDQRVEARRRVFDAYVSALGEIPGLRFMPEAPYGRSSRWLTTLTVDPHEFGASHQDIIEALAADNIEARPVWKPMHLQPVFTRARVFGGAVSARLFETGLCLPSGTDMSEEDIARVTGIVRSTPR